MKKENQNQLTRTRNLEWIPLEENGVKTSGIFIKSLRTDNTTNRAPSFMLKFEAGASYPNHNHPAGEEVFVLEGDVRFASDHLLAGDYLYTAPGQTHSVFSRTDCILLFIVPQEVEILK